MLARIKGWFGKKPDADADLILARREQMEHVFAPGGSKTIAHALSPDAVAAWDNVRAPVPETITSASLPRDRFKVQRIEDGVTYEAYSGDDGVEALEAWEAYQGSEKLGVFTFMDGATCRGSFAR